MAGLKQGKACMMMSISSWAGRQQPAAPMLLITLQPWKTLTVLSSFLKPLRTWKGSQALRSSFSAKVMLL